SGGHRQPQGRCARLSFSPLPAMLLWIGALNEFRTHHSAFPLMLSPDTPLRHASDSDLSALAGGSGRLVRSPSSIGTCSTTGLPASISPILSENSSGARARSFRN